LSDVVGIVGDPQAAAQKLDQRLMMAANDLLDTNLLVTRASQQARLVRERVFQSGVF
jgi:hypothetical protein